MSRLRFKGTLPPQLPCPPLCDVAASPFPPTSPRIIGSLSLSACPPLWRSPLCSRHETHSGCSVCEAELTEYPRSPDNPLVLKAHHRLMYPLHKHSDGLLTFSGLMRDSAHLRICAKGEYLHRAPFFYAVMWFFCNTRALVAIVISDVGHPVFLFQCYYFLPPEWDKVFKKKYNVWGDGPSRNVTLYVPAPCTSSFSSIASYHDSVLKGNAVHFFFFSAVSNQHNTSVTLN